MKCAVLHDEINLTLPPFPQMFYGIVVAFLTIPLHQSRWHYGFTSMECPILTAELKQRKLALRAHILGFPPIGTHYSILHYNLYMVPRNTNIRASQPEGLLVSFS